MMWWEVLFWILLVPVLIILGITYGTGKKLYKLLYVLATYTYIILATYVIDVFQLGRNWILSILVFSAILLILLGYRMSKSKKKKNKKKTHKNLYWAIIVLVLMLALILLGSLASGLTRTVKVVDNVNLDMNQTTDEGLVPKVASLRIMTLTYENKGFLSAPITEKNFIACAYDLEGQGYEVYLETEPSDYINYEEVAPGEIKKVFVNINRPYTQGDNLVKVVVVGLNHDTFYDCSAILGLKGEASIYEEIPVMQ